MVTQALSEESLDSRLTVKIDHPSIPLIGLCGDCGVNAIMQLIPFNNSDTSHSHGKVLRIQDTYKFTVNIHVRHVDGQKRGNSILPLYYLCCEQRLAPSMLYITLVLLLRTS